MKLELINQVLQVINLEVCEAYPIVLIIEKFLSLIGFPCQNLL